MLYHKDMKTPIRFDHGLGDCAQFAHQLPLYRKRGIDIALSCSRNKRVIFKASNVDFILEGEDTLCVPWHESLDVPPEHAEL